VKTSDRSRSIRLIGALAAALGALAGCDPGSLSAPSAARCVEVGAQCQLEAGPLGVCERAECAPGLAPPCFQCTPQH